MTKTYPPTPPEWASTPGNANDFENVLEPQPQEKAAGFIWDSAPTHQEMNWLFYQGWKTLKWVTEKVRRVDGDAEGETALEIEGAGQAVPGLRIGVAPGTSPDSASVSVIEVVGRVRNVAHRWLQFGAGGGAGENGKPLLMRISTLVGVTPWTHAEGGETGLHIYHGGINGTDPDSLPTSNGLGLINGIPSDDNNTRDSTIQAWGSEAGGTKRRMGWLRWLWDSGAGRSKLELRAWSGSGSTDGVATLRGDGRFDVSELLATGDVVSQATVISVAVNTGDIDAEDITADSLAAPVVRAPMVPWAWAKADTGPALPAAEGISAIAATGSSHDLTIDPPLPSTNGCVVVSARGGLIGGGEILSTSTVRVTLNSGVGSPVLDAKFDVLVFALPA